MGPGRSLPRPGVRRLSLGREAHVQALDETSRGSNSRFRNPLAPEEVVPLGVPQRRWVAAGPGRRRSRSASGTYHAG